MRPDLFTIPGINWSVSGYGLMVTLAFIIPTWWTTLRARRLKADPDVGLNIALISLIFGWIGGRTFYVIHYWRDQFADNPVQILNTCGGGFEVYGGLISAFGASLLYGWWRKLSIRMYGDIIMPTILLGLGIGRLGCFLYGCCWGGTCSASIPWSLRFPFASPAHQQQWHDRLVSVPAKLIFIDPAGAGAPMPRPNLKQSPDDRRKRLDKVNQRLADAEKAGDEKKIARARTLQQEVEIGVGLLQRHFERFETTPAELRAFAAGDAFRSRPVHPAQLYSAVGPMLLAWLTSAYSHRRKRHGTVMALGLMLYPIERFIEEAVRIDNPRDTFGLTVSQGISLAIFLIGLTMWLVLQKMPLRSARAVPHVPKGSETAEQSVAELAPDPPAQPAS